MACREMLVLCGETYPFRLWCVWELFTLLAFTKVEVAVERLSVMQVGCTFVRLLAVAGIW